MERRDFLIGMAAAGVGLGCGARAGQPTLPMASDRDGRDIRARMDETLEGLDRLAFVSSLRTSNGSDAYLRHADALARAVIKSMVVSAAVKELPPGTQAPPVLAEAIESQLPALHDTLIDSTALFAHMPLQERRRISRRLRAEPELAMTVTERCDDLARAAEVSRNGRMLLRTLGSSVAFRMTKQSVSGFFDDQVRKVERAYAMRGLDATLHSLVRANALSASILAALSQQAGGGGAQALGQPEASAPPPEPQWTVVTPSPQDPQQNHTARDLAIVSGGAILVGAGLFGIAVLVGGIAQAGGAVSALSSGAGVGGALAMVPGTVAVVTGIGALIALAVNG